MESTCIICGFFLCKCWNLWGMSSQDLVQVSTYEKWPSASNQKPSDYFSSCPACLRTFAFAPHSAATCNQSVLYCCVVTSKTQPSHKQTCMWWAEIYLLLSDVWVGTSWVVSSLINTLLLRQLASWHCLLCLETYKWIPGWQGPQTYLTSSLAWYVESSGRTLYV